MGTQTISGTFLANGATDFVLNAQGLPGLGSAFPYVTNTVAQQPGPGSGRRIRVRLTGFVYRAHNPRWAFAPGSGFGAASTGGRFNPVGVPALYTALRFETAWLEAQQAFPFKAQKMTLCAYAVECEDVLDLTDAATLTAHGIAAADLACPWKDLATRGIKPPSWTITERLMAAGTAGVIVPSFASGTTAADINVVFWDWTPDPPRQVRVIDDEARLPRDALSWR